MSEISNRQISPAGVDPVEELNFRHPEPRYIRAILITTLLSYLTLMGLALLLLVSSLEHKVLFTAIIEGVLALAGTVNLCLLRRIYDARGYALREHDITCRRGLFFPAMTTIPYSRIQQVSVGQNPVTRALGLYALEIVSGAQTSSLSIPGLSEETARDIKSILIQKSAHGENRH